MKRERADRRKLVTAPLRSLGDVDLLLGIYSQIIRSYSCLSARNRKMFAIELVYEVLLLYLTKLPENHVTHQNHAAAWIKK
jgi:hypothetical protein